MQICMCMRFIFCISTADVETVEDQDALYAEAEEAHARAVAGENFTDLILEYGDDSYMATYPEDGLLSRGGRFR